MGPTRQQEDNQEATVHQPLQSPVSSLWDKKVRNPNEKEGEARGKWGEKDNCWTENTLTGAGDTDFCLNVSDLCKR